MKTLTLYSTLGCHLCEVAKETVWPLIRHRDIKLVELDIADSDVLMEKYALMIPVLKCEGIEAELAWPFNAGECEHFISEHLIVDC
jgi:hypothetical protein